MLSVIALFLLGFSQCLQGLTPFTVGMGAGLPGNLHMVNELDFTGFVKDAGEYPITIDFGALKLHATRSLAGRIVEFSKIIWVRGNFLRPSRNG